MITVEDVLEDESLVLCGLGEGTIRYVEVTAVPEQVGDVGKRSITLRGIRGDRYDGRVEAGRTSAGGGFPTVDRYSQRGNTIIVVSGSTEGGQLGGEVNSVDLGSGEIGSIG